jgi:hypothetical protein
MLKPLIEVFFKYIVVLDLKGLIEILSPLFRFKTLIEGLKYLLR